MPIPVTVWKCEHCLKRRLASKSKIKKHEKECWYNPANRTCVTCFNTRCKLNISRAPNTPPKINCNMWKDEVLQEADYE